MQLIVSSFSSAQKNLALEEFLFKSTDKNICLLYRNSSSVIIGKHQNAFAEVNLRYCSENNIPVVRRISGGGAVYHDEGNINISLIKTEHSDNKVNYQPLLDFIKGFLDTKGLSITQGERNDLYLSDKKITGTACHIFKSRTLHHGTLLYDTRLTPLKESTRVSLDLETKGVQSRRSSVINISKLLKPKMNSNAFLKQLIRFCNESMNWELMPLPEGAHSKIEEAIQARYSQLEWNIDYSPKALIHWPHKQTMYQLKVIKGIIQEITEEVLSDSENKIYPSKPVRGMRMHDLILQ